MPKAVIFDIDGTLVDSVDLHARAWQETLRHFGYDIEFEQIRSQIGKGGDQLLPVFLSKEQLEREQKRIEDYRADLFKKKYLGQIKAFPGVRELFQQILSAGQRIALASSARADELEDYKRIANIQDLVDAETSSSDAKKSKPHPDIFEAALARLGDDIAPEDVIVVGDSPHDAEAAKRARLAAIGVLCGGFAEQDLRKTGAMAIYEGPWDLARRYDESPLAARQAARSG